MSQYTFSTREYGPNAKGSTLTWEDLDYSLLFLSESLNEIEFYPLSGSNYTFVEANGTPTQNGLSLSASYALAKTASPSSSSRFAVLLGPGKYQLASNFTFNTAYIDVVSLTGYKDVYVTGSGTIVVGADNIYVRGIDTGNSNFTITGSFPNTIIKNCKGGDESFGGNPTPPVGLPPSPGYTIASTFIDCEGGDRSFAGYGSAYGTFINCTAGSGSFGNYCDGIFKGCVGGNNSFATLGNIEGGTFENCTGGDNSFASALTIDAGSKLKECIGGINSFASLGTIDGLIENCQVTVGIFSTLLLGATGQMVNCFGPNQTPQTQP
jgi:hypothetical protein